MIQVLTGKGISVTMLKLCVIVLVTFMSTTVNCFRNDLNVLQQQQPSRQGCIWSTVTNVTTTSKNPSFLLDCNLRTLNVDFWNYTFNKAQIEQTSKVEIKCSDKLYFESFLSQNQSLFRLLNLKDVNIQKCKIRTIPSRIFGSLGFLQRLSLTTENAEWSPSVGLEVEKGAFEGLGQLEYLQLSKNLISTLPDKVLCPLRKLVALNISMNRLSDVEELVGSSEESNCALNVENLDLSRNALRRVNSNAFSSMTRISHLYLQYNLISELSDTSFEQLNQIKVLNVSSNRLVAIPPFVFKFNVNLRELYIQNNSLSALSPQVFSKLERLQVLDLSKNTFTSQWIKENMFDSLVRLVVLKISHNQLSYIDGQVFKNLHSLTSLHLDGNRIESIHPQAFSALTKLQTLDLQYNRLSVISKHFSNLFSIRQLFLDHNKMRSIDDDALKNCSNVQDIGLSNNQLQEVPVALRGLSLVTLDIGENRISSVNNESFLGLKNLYGLRIVDNSVTQIESGFCDPLRNLRVLNAAQNKIKSIADAAFTSCPELRALRLDSNDLQQLPNLATLPSLLWLNVSENRIRYADYHHLPATIEWLDLSYNALESISSSSEEATPNLRVLDASFNRLTSMDYKMIPPTLETLRVNNNLLKTVASDSFKRSTNLRRVDLQNNQIETLPLSSLRIHVPVEKALPEFFLSGNTFKCSTDNEWLTRLNHLNSLRTHPRIIDLNSVTCQPTFSRHNGPVLPQVETLSNKDFLSNFTKKCFTLCTCCEFEHCDCMLECSGFECYNDPSWSTIIVDLSNMNFKEVPKRIPMAATEIYLDGNQLNELSNHIFIGKTKLRILYLNNTKLYAINNRTFNSLHSLEILHMEDNELQELQGFEFQDVPKLKELYLHNNLLNYIAKDTFKRLINLELLRLDGNLLIDFNIWALSENGYLNSVTLASNPWSCDCEFLIPFRTWVASKTEVVVADFALANCLTVNTTHGVTGISSSTEMDHSSYGQVIPHGKVQGKIYPIQMQHPISSMCNHNSELNFNFNPIPAIESEILNNHISAMAGGAEKVTISHPSDSIQFSPAGSDSMNTFWSLCLVLTSLIVLVCVIAAIFRKEIYYWIYTRMCSSNSSSSQELRGAGNRGFFSTSSSLFCCGEKGGMKSRRSAGDGVDESDKLFDAYFIYGKQDEEVLVQKIAPELESQGPPQYRLCLHYRDLCLNPDNPWNTDMILTASDAAKRVVLVLSRSFLQSELSHSHFRQAIQSAINRHQKKLILILLPPFSEQNLSTIYPELKTSQVKSSTLEWTDKNFWSKLKLILPTPSNISTFSNTIGRNNRSSRGSSLLISGPPPPLIDLGGGGSNASGTMSTNSYTINRLDFPYNSGGHHQYHRNILPYQIPMSNTLNPPVPKHHIALTTSTPFYPHHQQINQPQSHYHQSQQNFSLYNASQHSSASQQQHYFLGNNNVQNFLPVGGGVIYPMATLPHPPPPQHYSFNESFRRHLEQQQSHQAPLPVIQFAKQQSSSSSSALGNNASGQVPTTGCGYQPLEANYSSSAVSSADEIEHVYSTLDSPIQSPNTTSSTTGESQGISESANKLGNTFSNKRNNNCNGNGSQSFKSERQQQGTNGEMYFV